MVRELLQVHLRSCIVTVDALDTQKAIAAQMGDQEAEYVPALTSDHGTVHQKVADFSLVAQQERTLNYDIGTHRTVDGEHGRIETRCNWQVQAPEHLSESAQWQDLRGVGMIEATGELDDRQSTGSYLGSFPLDAVRFGECLSRPLEHRKLLSPDSGWCVWGR